MKKYVSWNVNGLRAVMNKGFCDFFREVEAESVAYVVCQHFGIDTADYSFAYVASWSRDKELETLKASINRIHTAAAEMISCMEGQEKEQAQSAPQRRKQAGRLHKSIKKAAPSR